MDKDLKDLLRVKGSHGGKGVANISEISCKMERGDKEKDN